MTTGEMKFDKLETEGEAPASGTCDACKGALGATYWTINGSAACERCKTSVEALGQPQPGGAARFVKALVFGAVGGAAGALVWFLVAHFLHIHAGLVAILIGFLVGGGVRMGAEGRGGWLYQLVAVVLAYVSIVAGWVPDIVDELRDEPDVPGGAGLYVMAVIVGFVAPLFSSIIGTIITLFALWEAWKMNRRPKFEIAGPLRLAPPAPPPLPDAPPPLG